MLCLSCFELYSRCVPLQPVFFVYMKCVKERKRWLGTQTGPH